MPSKQPAILSIKVTPNAQSNRVSKQVGVDGATQYKIHTSCTPAAGKANKAVIALLAKELGIPKSSIAIVRGHTARTKLIKIEP